MKLHQVPHLLLSFGFALTLVACNSSSIRSDEVAKSEGGSFCPRTPSFIEATGPSAQPTPTGQLGVAKSYDQIWAGLLSIEAESSDSDYGAGEMTVYMRQELDGKLISGWEGWVVSTGLEANRSIEASDWWWTYRSDEDPANSAELSNVVLVSTEDPFGPDPDPRGRQTGRWYELNRPYIALIGAKEASKQQLCIGQKIRFDGYVAVSPGIGFYRGDYIVSPTTVDVVENSLPARDIPADLEDVFVKMKRIPGWSGPDYQVMVFGDGTVVFENTYITSPFFRITTISEGKVRELLDEFERAEFLSMPDYDEYYMSDSSYVITSLVRDGRHNTVTHYYGNSLPDEKITALEDRIEEIVGIERWVRKNDK
jgi:hypothetical protein